MADQGVIFEGILLKPSMVTPGADCKKRATPEQVRMEISFSLRFSREPGSSPSSSHFAHSLSLFLSRSLSLALSPLCLSRSLSLKQVADYTLKLLRRRVPPAVPGIMFLSGGQSELEATLNLNAMNQTPNPWHVSFSYARALQNSVLRTWQGEPANLQKAQEALLVRAKANSDAQKGKFVFLRAERSAAKKLTLFFLQAKTEVDSFRPSSEAERSGLERSGAKKLPIFCPLFFRCGFFSSHSFPFSPAIFKSNNPSSQASTTLRRSPPRPASPSTRRATSIRGRTTPLLCLLSAKKIDDEREGGPSRAALLFRLKQKMCLRDLFFLFLFSYKERTIF